MLWHLHRLRRRQPQPAQQTIVGNECIDLSAARVASSQMLGNSIELVGLERAVSEFSKHPSGRM
jgi:hypothetical protein